MPLTPEENLRLAVLRNKITASTSAINPIETERRRQEAERNQTRKTLGNISQSVADLPIIREVINEALAGVKSIQRGLGPIEQDVGILSDIGGRTFNILGGTISTIFSPVTGLVKDVVGTPAAKLAELFGASPETAENIGLGAELAAGLLIPFAGASKLAKLSKQVIQKEQKAKQIIKLAGEDAKKARATGDKKGFLEAQEKIRDTAINQLGRKHLEKDFFTKELAVLPTPEAFEKMVRATSLSKIGDDTKATRLYQDIMKMMKTPKGINPAEMPKLVRKFNLSPAEYAGVLGFTASLGGRYLNILSQARKTINKMYANNPKAAAEFEKATKELKKLRGEGEVGPLDIFMRSLGRFDRVRRGLIVTQLATSSRNAIATTGRMALSAVDEAFQGAIKGAGALIAGKGAAKAFDEIKDGLNIFSGFVGRLSSKNRAQLTKILEAPENETVRLFSQAGDELLLGGKAVQLLNTVNRTTEFFFRKIAYESKLRQLLRRRDKDFGTISANQILHDEHKMAIDYALEMTFASAPKSKTGKAIVEFMTKFGTTVNPFPRFAYANALPFIVDHSPLGMLHMLKPSVWKGLARGNSDEFAKIASRVTMGSLMMASAGHIRNSDMAGENWYDIKVGDRTIDTRAFAPFSTYMFFAEMIGNPGAAKNRASLPEFATMIVGLNRVSGTGLILIDALRAQKSEQAFDTMKRFTGQYFGSFTVPFRTAKDVVSAFDPEEAIIRDMRTDPVIGPVINNIPFVSQLLPEKPSALKRERLTLRTLEQKGTWIEKFTGKPFAWGPLLRQATGLSLRDRNALEKETLSLGIRIDEIRPSTGIPDADNRLAEYMGGVLEEAGEKVIKSPAYKALTDGEKLAVMKDLFTSGRKFASQRLAVEEPELALAVMEKRLGRPVKEILKERGIDVLSLLGR